jgi:hypothetical protein
MSNYDFAYLSSFDFEVLVRDLLQKDLNLTLESFKSGRDEGIDLRYSKDSKGSLIVQCKHYIGSTLRRLIHSLKTEEREKVHKLQPGRYLLATSLGLTPKNKEEIREIFYPYCLSPADILGKDDINNLLGKFSDIERKNFKLWLTSQAVLERVLHNAIFTRTDFELENIQRKLKFYVQNQSYFKAQKILDEHHCCIIAGIPGIGKTTLAEILMVDYSARDYEVIKVSSNIREAAEVYNPLVKQFFYYDDFLGQTSLEQKFGKNEEQCILDFIDAVGRSKSSKLVLTTREYILNQARTSYEKIDRRGIEIFKCVINFTDYTKYEKAKILYNHAYFSGLPSPYINALVENRNYLKIIDHRNFSPRIVEWMTDFLSSSSVSAKDYLTVFVGNLNSPTRLWEHAFHNQISNSARHLMLVLGTLSAEVLLDDLELAFTSFYKARAKQFGFPTLPGDFKRALKELEGNFVLTQRFGESTIVKFHNPSIKDFLETHLATNQSDIRALLNSLVFFDQIVVLWEKEETERPSVRDVLKQLPDELWSCIERLYLLSDSRLINLVREPGRVIDKRKYPMPLETRIVHALEIASRLSSEISSSIIKTMLEAELEQIKSSKSDKDALMFLLPRLEKAGMWYGIERNSFMELAKNYLFKDLEDIDSFTSFLEFEKTFPEFVSTDEHDEIGSKFASFLHGELDWLEYDADDADLVNKSLSSLLQVAKVFDISIKSRFERIEERIGELHARASHEEGDYGDDWRYGDPSGDRTFTDIDGLFDSLRGSETP